MLLTLFRVQGTRYWHDICINEYLAEDGEWYPDSGEDPIDFYVWGLSERWVRDRYEGGYHSRKDSDITDIDSVTPVRSLPDGAQCENTGSFGEWYTQFKFDAPNWTAPVLRPWYFWVNRWGPFRYRMRKLMGKEPGLCI